MKNLLILGMLLVSTQSFASDKGNGGGAHVCGTSVELYDFYEGRNPILYGLSVWETDPTLSVKEYVEKAMAHLKNDVPGIGQYVEKRVNELLKIPYNEIVHPIIIPRTLDADIPMIDENCEFKQVASWNERFGKIFFSKSVFEKMDNKSKAGLYIHEVLYKIARESGLGITSNGVRMLVAQIFSDVIIKESDLEEQILPEGTILFIPKKGMCEISIRVNQPFNGAPFFGIMGTPQATKKDKRNLPCEDIATKELKLVIFTNNSSPDVSPLVNDKKIRRSVRDLYVWNNISYANGRLIVTVKPEKIFLID